LIMWIRYGIATIRVKHASKLVESKNNMKAFNQLRKLYLTGAVAALLPLMAFSQSAPATNAVPQGLEKAVRHELVMLPYFTIFDNLAFKVDGGTVTLYGKVTRPSLKQDAGRVVAHVEGVEHVDNQIEVLPLSPFDNKIRWQTARAIYGYPTLNRYGMGTQPSIRIIVDNGHVTLEGVVNNQSDKNVAGIRANQVPGVFSVTNDLRIGS
jgi:hyperosmotically inducible protein